VTAFQIDTSDVERGILRVANLVDLVAGPIREAMKDVADTIRTDTISTISRQAPPRSQKRQPPARVTGALIASLRTKLAKPNRNGMRAYVVSSNLKDRYAFMLESGTRRIVERPFLVPAAMRHRVEFVQKVEAAIQLAIKQSTS
jgi:hypothetical protein